MIDVKIPVRPDPFTVAEAIDALGYGKFQFKVAVFTALYLMADSMEMMILSILAPALQCEWSLSELKQASLTFVVFAGMMICAPIWGYLSDRSGRRLALWISSLMLFTFGLASSFSPSYYWLVAFRLCVGFSVGCIPQAVTLYSEFLPTKHRGKCLIFMHTFWALGACLEVSLAIFVMPTLGWQWLLGFSAIPVCIYSLVCYWLPESVRYLSTSGETQKAMETLKRISKENGRPMLAGRLIYDDVHSNHRGKFKELFKPEIRRTTFILWFLWMSYSFCYYGVVLMSAQLLKDFEVEAREKLAENMGVMGSNFTLPDNGTMESCARLTTMDYLNLLWITLAEFPGVVITLFVMDRIGRKKTVGVQFLLFAITVMTLYFPIQDRLLMTVALFFARGTASIVLQAVNVYTPEVYPTSIRAIGMGSCSSMSRIGAMATPFVAHVLLENSRSLAVSCYGIVAILAASLSIFLPIETNGKQMPDSISLD